MNKGKSLAAFWILLSLSIVSTVWFGHGFYKRVYSIFIAPPENTFSRPEVLNSEIHMWTYGLGFSVIITVALALLTMYRQRHLKKKN